MKNTNQDARNQAFTIRNNQTNRQRREARANVQRQPSRTDAGMVEQPFNELLFTLKPTFSLDMHRLLLTCVKGYYDSAESELAKLQEVAYFASDPATLEDANESLLQLADDLRHVCGLLLQITDASYTRLEHLHGFQQVNEKASNTEDQQPTQP